MFRSVTPLFVLAPHDSNVAVCVQVCLPYCVLYMPGICRCFNLALFLQDDGFDPPYGSNPLPIVNFLFIYTETSTLKEII